MFTYLMMPGYSDFSWQGHTTNGEVLQCSVEVFEELALCCVFAGISKECEKYFVVVAAVMRRRYESPRLY
jgi:hypothetical protein